MLLSNINGENDGRLCTISAMKLSSFVEVAEVLKGEEGDCASV